MGFNFNRQSSADFNLKERQIKETISLYGVNVDLLDTTKMNIDKIMGDFSHLKIGTEKETIDLMPEDSQGWEGDMGFDMWGLNNMRVINFFCSKDDFKKAVNFLSPDRVNDSVILNSLIVLPSGTVMEISSFTTQVEGINNLFTYADEASVYRLTARVYNHSKQNEVEVVPELETTEKDDEIQENFDDIDTYFKSLDNEDIEEEVKKNLPDDHSVHDETMAHGKDDSVFGTLG